MENFKRVSNRQIFCRREYNYANKSTEELLDMLNIKVTCISTKDEIVASRDFVGTLLPKIKKLIIK